MRINSLALVILGWLLLQQATNADWKTSTYPLGDYVYESFEISNGTFIKREHELYSNDRVVVVHEFFVPLENIKSVEGPVFPADMRSATYVFIHLKNPRFRGRWIGKVTGQVKEYSESMQYVRAAYYQDEAGARELIAILTARLAPAPTPPPRVEVRTPPPAPQAPPPPVVAPEPQREFDSLQSLISKLEQPAKPPVRLGDVAKAELPESPGNARDLVDELRAARRPMLAGDEIDRRFREILKQKDSKLPDEATGEWSTITGTVTCWGNDRIWIKADVLMFIVNSKGNASPNGPYIEVKNSSKMPITVTGDFMARNIIVQPGETVREMANVGYSKPYHAGEKPQWDNVKCGVTVKYWQPKKK